MSGNASNQIRQTDIEVALLRSQTIAAAGQFAASVMHEINNPLEAIANLNWLVLNDADDAARIREHSRQISEQLSTVIRIARRTLTFYRPADVLESIDMGTLAEAALRIHGPKLSGKRVALVQDIPAEATIFGHAGQILQVLTNILSNSIDALPPNGRLILRVRKRKGEVHLTIADEGHGIPDSIRKQIFEPFFTTKKDRGTGLGLVISRAIIERHKGRIRVRSSVQPGRTGTAFRISLPMPDDSTAIPSRVSQMAS